MLARQVASVDMLQPRTASFDQSAETRQRLACKPKFRSDFLTI